MTCRRGMGILLVLIASGAVSAQQAIRFENVASLVGIQFEHTSGASPETYLVETVGSGGVFFDFDSDGWLGVFLVDGGSSGGLVDGGSMAARDAAGKARHRLYRNRGNGTFDEVTAASGIVHREYGMGACS